VLLYYVVVVVGGAGFDTRSASGGVLLGACWMPSARPYFLQSRRYIMYLALIVILL